MSAHNIFSGRNNKYLIGYPFFFSRAKKCSFKSSVKAERVFSFVPFGLCKLAKF